VISVEVVWVWGLCQSCWTEPRHDLAASGHRSLGGDKVPAPTAKTGAVGLAATIGSFEQNRLAQTWSERVRKNPEVTIQKAAELKPGNNQFTVA